MSARVEHLVGLRDLQDRTGGFTAFIPWTFQDENTDLEGQVQPSGGVDYLRTLAVSRLALDNFDHVPVLILPCLVRYRAPTPMEGASVYPAVQNLLLAARALGYGGVITGFHGAVDAALKELQVRSAHVQFRSPVKWGRYKSLRQQRLAA